MAPISSLGTISLAVWLSVTVGIPRADKAKSFCGIMASSSGSGKRLICPAQPYVCQSVHKVDSRNEIAEG